MAVPGVVYFPLCLYSLITVLLGTISLLALSKSVFFEWRKSKNGLLFNLAGNSDKWRKYLRR